jgi:hypothetical protein
MHVGLFIAMLIRVFDSLTILLQRVQVFAAGNE